jgi:hypothetical protein
MAAFTPAGFHYISHDIAWRLGSLHIACSGPARPIACPRASSQRCLAEPLKTLNVFRAFTDEQ